MLITYNSAWHMARAHQALASIVYTESSPQYIKDHDKIFNITWFRATFPGDYRKVQKSIKSGLRILMYSLKPGVKTEQL